MELCLASTLNSSLSFISITVSVAEKILLGKFNEDYCFEKQQGEKFPLGRIKEKQGKCQWEIILSNFKAFKGEWKEFDIEIKSLKKGRET